MYCTPSELREYLGITVTTDDSLLSALLNASKNLIDRYTGRTFEADSDTIRYFDSYRNVDGVLLYLDADLCVITSITNGGGASVAGSNYVTEPRNSTPYYAIRLKPSSTVNWQSSSNGDTENAIAITGRWAYSTKAPDIINHACKRLAAYLYRQKDNANDLDRAVVAGNSTILPSQIPSDIRLMLESYKVIQ